MASKGRKAEVQKRWTGPVEGGKRGAGNEGGRGEREGREMRYAGARRVRSCFVTYTDFHAAVLMAREKRVEHTRESKRSGHYKRPLELIVGYRKEVSLYT
jgi:hypothetical protein